MALSQPSWDPSARPTGCIDTPFVGPDHRSTTSGIRCGREASPEAALLRGRVVGEAMAGLPGAGLEAVWVSVHPLDGPLEIGHLPPARAEVETGPQGAFTIALAGAGEYVIAVRGSRTGPVLAARRIDGTGDARQQELVLIVPLGQVEQVERAAPKREPKPTPKPEPSEPREPGQPFEPKGTEPPSSP